MSSPMSALRCMHAAAGETLMEPETFLLPLWPVDQNNPSLFLGFFGLKSPLCQTSWAPFLAPPPTLKPQWQNNAVNLAPWGSPHMKGNIASWVSQFPYDKKHNTSRDNLQCLGHSVVMWKEQGVGNLVGNNSDIKTVLLLKYPRPEACRLSKSAFLCELQGTDLISWCLWTLISLPVNPGVGLG